jgi:hypothetical protein
LLDRLSNKKVLEKDFAQGGQEFVSTFSSTAITTSRFHYLL